MLLDALIRRTFEFSYRNDSSELLQVFGSVLENQICRTAIMPSMCCICLDVENMLRVEFVGDSHRAQRSGYPLGTKGGSLQGPDKLCVAFFRGLPPSSRNGLLQGPTDGKKLSMVPSEPLTI